MSTVTINGISIDPVAQQNDPHFAALAAVDSGSSDFILIQSIAPLNLDQRQTLTALDIEILEYVPENAYACRYPHSDLDRIRALPFVTWANVYLEEFKIPPHLRSTATTSDAANLLALGEVETSMSQEPKRVVVVMHKGVDAETAREDIARAARLDPEDLQASENAIWLTVQPQQLEDLAGIDAVRHIEEYAPPKLHNNVALSIVRANETHETLHLEGEDQVIAVCDTGFDISSTTDVHPAFSGRVLKLYNLGRATANDPHGHGTHVAGSVLGDGHSNSMGGVIRGAAPKAKLVVQSVLDASGGLGGLPLDLCELLRVPYEEDGTRIHTNSWGVSGDSSRGRYTAGSEQIDRFVWDHRDYIICFSAGNEGADRNANGVVDNGSVTPPATAKNCITIGASESKRLDQSKPYGQPWGEDFPVNPLASDLWADNLDGIAAFSSRGPTKNGRIKPDVVAPGTAILSAHSRKASVGSFWGRSSDPLYAFMGGTSMATPLVAGCAAVIREFFQARYQSPPSAAMVKAILINGACDLKGQYVPSEAEGLPNLSEGFGRIDLANSVGLHSASTQLMHRDENVELDTGDEERLTLGIPVTGATLKATLVWTEPPGEALQNDLDLIVIAADGQERHGNMPDNSNDFDRINNVEQVVWGHIPSGEVQVIVRAHRISLHPQSYALVVCAEDANDAESTELDLSQLEVAITDIRLAQSGTTSLTADIGFQVRGINANTLIAAQTPFHVDVYVVNREQNTGPSHVAADVGDLQRLNTRRYVQFSMPSPGSYNLECRVILETSNGELTAVYTGMPFKIRR